MSEKTIKIGIVGAGIQGICNALFLQKKGFQVTLFDRDEPGNAASYGNAGHFSPYASVSLNRSDILADVPQMMHTAKYMHQILDQSLPAYDELFDDINLEGLVESKGILYVWTNKSLKSRELEIQIRDELGVKQQLVNPKEIHDLEPNLKPFYDGGVFYDYARHARNPRKILLKLFENFIEKGGKFLKLQRFVYDKLVIACGAFSKRLTDKLHENIPLDTERGYHVHFKGCDHLISRPIVYADRGFGMTPMEQGLRVVGTVEFGGLKNPPSKSRIKNLILNAKDMIDGLPEHKDEWLGFRPSLPDFLPVLGPSKNYKNVYYSFGHHHLGWTLGAISGKIISKMIANENTNLNLDPYKSLRFS